MARSFITVTQVGNFRKTEKFLKSCSTKDLKKILSEYGKRGVELLAAATPKDTGKTAASWSYEIVDDKNGSSIYFKNSSFVGNTPIVVLIRYGHATRNGGYVVGNDFISPVVKNEFKKMADEIWKEVTK